MALWWTALRRIPWTEVIAAAPTVAQGAKRMWRSARRHEMEGPDLAPTELERASHDPLVQEIAAIRAEAATLREQQLEAANLIQSLAQQNEQLVAAVQVLQARVRLLAAFGAALLVAVVVLFFV